MLIDASVFGGLQLRLKPSDQKHPEVLYAGQAPGPGSRPTGGRVKLIHLAGEFPDAGLRGNILYLVSSVLPRGAVAWARAARRKGIRVVLNQNGVAFPAWTTLAECERINRRNRLVMECADHVLFQSEFCKQGVERWVGSRKDAWSILPNCVDTEHFKPLASRRGEIRLIVMGSHWRKERVSLPIDALKILRGQGAALRLRLVGRFLWPDAHSEIQKWVREAGLQDAVSIEGAYSQDEAVSHYQGSDILLHLLDKDASPTVPLESMACGVPVVCLRSGGMPELVTPDTGALIDVPQAWESYHYPQAAEVARAVAELIPRLESASIRARQRVETRFSKPGWLAAHGEVFRRVLSAR